MQKNQLRLLALLLALVLVIGVLPSVSAEPAQYQTISQLLEVQRKDFAQAASDPEVCFIVELEEPALTQSMPQGMLLADYLDSARGAVTLDALERQQNAMAAAIERTADASVTHRYQVVLNGFAVTAPLSARAAIEALEGVKRVTLGNVYNLPELQEAEGEVITSGELIRADDVQAEGYTGKGTFAAILDTGLMVDHEAFVGETVQGAVITADTIANLEGLHANGDLYKNAKIAFAYDYADGDDDVSDSQGHGTHVAGTVAANGDHFRGVAPDAQLAILKVFGDNGGASDADIFAALEDCVILGVDTVNMSLGSPCGFSYEDEATEAVYNAVRSAGINLMVSAGNDADAANQNLHGIGLALASNPDYGIVGSPSTYAAALSVASVNEALAWGNYLLLGDRKISYDENPESYYKLADLEGEYAYVQVLGVGTANDFANVDVTGKIALVDRGDIAFTEKEQNACNSGAVALIVCNNSDAEETVYMQLNGLLPAVFLSKAEGELLKSAQDKIITISAAFSGRMESPVAGQMSDFSSLGVAPDMSLKPEITAPGGNVWSASISGGYEEMSGTSMAAPHMTGAAALVRQYVTEAFPALSDFEKQALADQLLLSTAEPVLDENSVAYTPRKQGAGLANLSAAIHAGAYLTVDGGLPKAQLGESANGRYEFTFTVHNISDTAKTYHIALDPIAAQVENIGGLDYISQLCRSMAANELDVTFSSETVTIQPGASADVTVTIALTDAGKENLSVFPNGIYVEGFVRLTGDDVTPLGLPYLGFYGDWADAPIFDSTMYDDAASFMAESAMAQIDYNGSGNYLGVNAVTGSARAEWISYASQTAGYYLLTPMQGLLRAPKEIRYTAASADAPDTVLYEVAYQNAVKSFYYSAGGYIYTDFVPWEDAWQPIGGNDTVGYHYLPDGQYVYTIQARIDGEDEFQIMQYPVYIDNAAPRILSHSYKMIDSRPHLVIRITDDHYVMAAQLVDESFTKALSGIIAVEETEIGAVTELTFDLTDIQADGYTACRLDLYDYAWNELLSDPIPTDGTFDAPADKTELDRAIASAEALDPDHYTPDTWAAVEKALADAKAVSADANAAQEEIDAALETLNAAVAGLAERSDFSALNAAIAAAKSLAEEVYTPDSWAILKTTLEAAEAVAADPNAAQEEIDAALGSLNAAVAALQERADLDALLAAMEAAESLVEYAYTADSWAALQTALETARAVAANPNATQEEVNAALADLTAAQYGLVLRGDAAQLAQLHAEAGLDRSRLAPAVFPAQLIDALDQALAAAEQGLRDRDSTQEQLDELHFALLHAWNTVKDYAVNTMYTDISSGEWFYAPTDFVTRYGFMNGMDAGAFNPGFPMNRAQFVVILYRLAGSPAVEGDNPFVDVPAGDWYTDAVLWAYHNGITTGTDATHFNPGGTLVRQNMVTLLMRFAQKMGIDTAARADLSCYTDAGLVLPYAQDAMSWAVESGIISGMSETTLGPNGLANRAQIATIISRFVPKYLW